MALACDSPTSPFITSLATLFTLHSCLYLLTTSLIYCFTAFTLRPLLDPLLTSCLQPLLILSPIHSPTHLHTHSFPSLPSSILSLSLARFTLAQSFIHSIITYLYLENGCFCTYWPFIHSSFLDRSTTMKLIICTKVNIHFLRLYNNQLQLCVPENPLTSH